MKKRRPLRRSKRRGRREETFREAAARLGPIFGPLLWLRWNHPDEEAREVLADVGRALLLGEAIAEEFEANRDVYARLAQR